MRVVCYCRVSTADQADSGISLEAQVAKMQAYAALYDLTIVEVITDAGESAKTLNRPGLQSALAMLKAGKADGLLIVKLDRLTRSIADWQDLIDAYFGERTKEALRHKINRRQRVGKVRFGYDLGEDGVSLVEDPAEQQVVALMRDLRAAGRTLREIAAEPTQRNIPTKEGNSQWQHQTVAYILRRAA